MHDNFMAAALQSFLFCSADYWTSRPVSRTPSPLGALCPFFSRLTAECVRGNGADEIHQDHLHSWPEH
jgi:hypothetical protein